MVRTLPGADPAGAAQAADELEWGATRERAVLSREQAADLIAARHSAEATTASRDDLDALARESEAALEHVAFGRRRRAEVAVQRILERAQRALETLNRESRSARRVLNSCLYLVRALHDGGDEPAALAQSMDCARLVPDMRPSATEHPPTVRDLFREAAERILDGPHGSLRVESRPPGCDVYVNGRRLGVTPFEREHLPTGEYRVQIECPRSGRSGRVHRVVLAAEPHDLLIDAGFDGALRTTTGDVRLAYEDAEEEEHRRVRDAMAVAGIVDATTVWLVTPEAPHVVRVDALRMPLERVVASVRVPLTAAGLGRELRDRAVEHLLAGRSVDLAAPVVRKMEAWAPPPEPRLPSPQPSAMPAREPAPPGDRAEPMLDAGWPGWALGGAGIAGLGVAWTLQAVWLRRHDAATDVPRERTGEPAYLERIEERDALDVPVMALGAAGAALGTAALPWIVDGDTRWWHWGVGAIGAGALAGGIGVWSQEGTCADAMCASLRRRVPLGPLLALTAVPLVAVPVVSLLVPGGANGGGANGGGANGSGANGSGANGDGANGDGATGDGATGSGATSSLVPLVGPGEAGILWQGRF